MQGITIIGLVIYIAIMPFAKGYFDELARLEPNYKYWKWLGPLAWPIILAVGIVGMSAEFLYARGRFGAHRNMGKD